MICARARHAAHERGEGILDDLVGHAGPIEQPLQQQAAQDAAAGLGEGVSRVRELHPGPCGDLLDMPADLGIDRAVAFQQRGPELLVVAGGGPCLDQDAGPASVRVVSDRGSRVAAGEILQAGSSFPGPSAGAPVSSA
jgi:hypothetical protein